MKVKQNKIIKKQWQKPELQVICRGESEENVLGSCKNHGSLWDNGPEGISCTSWVSFFCSTSSNS